MTWRSSSVGAALPQGERVGFLRGNLFSFFCSIGRWIVWYPAARTDCSSVWLLSIASKPRACKWRRGESRRQSRLPRRRKIHDDAHRSGRARPRAGRTDNRAGRRFSGARCRRTHPRLRSQTNGGQSRADDKSFSSAPATPRPHPKNSARRRTGQSDGFPSSRCGCLAAARRAASPGR